MLSIAEVCCAWYLHYIMYVDKLAILLEWELVTVVLRPNVIDNYLPIFSILLYREANLNMGLQASMNLGMYAAILFAQSIPKT